MIEVLAVENYRSLRQLTVRLGALTVITGANGGGKSSVYRALRLLAEAGANNAVAALAREGGLQSTLWAGPAVVRRAQARGNALTVGHPGDGATLRLGFAADDFGYAVEFGIPAPGMAAFGEPSLFDHDPEIKCEAVWSGPVLRPSSSLVERHNAVVTARTWPRRCAPSTRSGTGMRWPTPWIERSRAAGWR